MRHTERDTPKARRVTLAAALFAAAATFAASPRPAAAQDLFLPFQVPDHADAFRLAKDFEDESKAGNWPKAVDKLQQLLSLPADRPVVVRAKGFRPARFEGAGVVARRLFDSLPPEGRAAWETNSRGRAEELLSRGLRLRREDDLREAARRYPARDIRRRAHDALAQLALVRADLRTSQFQLESLVEAAEPGERAEALARLGWACAQTADADEFERVLAEAAPLRDSPVPSAGGTEPLGTFLEKMKRIIGTGAVIVGTARQFGGGPDGHGLSEPPPQPRVPRWSFPTNFEEGLENDNENTPLSFARDGGRLRPVQPLIAHGLVFVNNGLSLVAAKLASGVEAWRFDAPQQSPEWRDNYAMLYTAAVADGSVYAALATRSDRGDPDFDPHFQRYTIVYPLPHRSLYAFDERSGEVLWSHETARLDPAREDAAELRKECVSSPPLVVGEDLIVACWTYEGIYDVRLCCFDRRTGATRWRTSVVQGQQELNLFGRPVKELATGALAEHGGRVFFSTGVGVAAAVDREDGRIAWLSAYRQTDLPPAVRWFETRDRLISWWPSPVSASKDTVVMAPLDANGLLCFDPATGARRWEVSRLDSSNNFRWFLGTTGGRAYVTGTRAAAYDLATGALAWTGDSGRLAPAKEATTSWEAAGRGLLTRDRLYVPTDRAVVVLSTATGSVEETWMLERPAREAVPVTGNLVSGDGALLIVNRTHVNASYRFEDLRNQLESRLAQNPDDPQARLEVGEAFLGAGRLDEAISTLDAGLQRIANLAPRIRDRVEGSLRRTLYSARLARAEIRRQAQDDAGAAEDFRAAADVAREKGDAVRALFTLAEVLTASGRRTEADAALQRIATDFAEIVTTTRNGERAQAGALALHLLAESALGAGDVNGALARWLDLLEQRSREDLGPTDVATTVRARLADLAEAEPAAVAAAVQGRARKALAVAKAAGDVGALDRVARLYPDPQVAAESALAAAELHVAAARPRDAIGVLQFVVSEQQPPRILAQLLWRLATAYRALGETARERAVLRRLADEAPGEMVDGRTSAADAVKRELAEARFRNVGGTLANPVPPLRVLWQAGGADQIPPQTLSLAGAEPAELAGKIALARAGVLTLADGTTGQRLWEETIKVEVRTAAATPGAIVIAGGDTSTRERVVVVVAMSIADGHTLWRRRLAGQYRAAEATLGVLYVLHADSPVPGGRPTYTMTGVSLATGEVLAMRSFGGVLEARITAAEDAVVVTEPTRSRSGSGRALVTLDGTTLSLRGRLELTAPSSPFSVYPPLSNVVVTSDGAVLVAVDVGKGDAAWKVTLPDGRLPKKVFGVAQGVIVSDDGDGVRRLDAQTGRETWRTELSGSGTLVYEGEAAEGDLVIETIKPARGTKAVAVALDAATGSERWRTELALLDESTNAHPEILASVVAYDLHERLERGTRSRVILLDRRTGAILQEIEHPTIGRTYQRVVYGPDWIALSSTNELAVYGK